PTYVLARTKVQTTPLAGAELPPVATYHKHFPGHGIAMPPPLSDGRVTYTDGTQATLDQQAKDVTAFLAWAAEPHLVARKSMGMQVFAFLLVLSGLLYFTKKKVWREVSGHA